MKNYVMRNSTKYLLSVMAGAVAMMAASLAVSKCVSDSRPDTEVVTVRDTVVVYDTVRFEKPVPRIVRTVDTLLVSVADTVVVRDTVFVRIPMDTKIYVDSLYRLQVSGYQPQLDWIEVYPQTLTVREVQTITVSPDRKRWGIGIQVGYGAAVADRKVVLSPYVGLGVSYHFIRW